MHIDSIKRAVIAAVCLQVPLALLAHTSDWLALHVLLFGRMLISAGIGYVYALEAMGGYGRGAAAGAAVGGIAGLFGVAFSIVLGDADGAALVRDTAIAIAAGGLGGLFGWMAVAPPQPDRH